MPLDVRIPIGGLFLAVGALLLAYGVIGLGLGSDAGRLNSLWGAAMLVTGAVLSYYGLRAERLTRAREQAPTR
jgi:hypothetical protein